MLRCHSHPRQLDFKAHVHQYAVHPGDILKGTPEPLRDLNHLLEAPQKPEGSMSFPFPAEGRLGPEPKAGCPRQPRKVLEAGSSLCPIRPVHSPPARDKRPASPRSQPQREKGSAISHKQGDNSGPLPLGWRLPEQQPNWTARAGERQTSPERLHLQGDCRGPTMPRTVARKTSSVFWAQAARRSQTDRERNGDPADPGGRFPKGGWAGDTQ